MNTMTEKLGVIQNIGLTDRLIRGLATTGLLLGPVYHLELAGGGFTVWHGLLMLLSVYPAITAILGWDPFYQMADARSCKDTGRNQCGTLPYEVDAALGHRPVPDKDYDHSLMGSHHQAHK
ncbi:MAG: DUF2892 domain-containing protein [Gammaproteobacteria bacterium]|nr:DUF2892 domain-containing protein [Gammaproteobacteria bacterium]